MVQTNSDRSVKFGNAGKLTAVGAAALGAGLSASDEAKAVPIFISLNLSATGAAENEVIEIDIDGDGHTDFRFTSRTVTQSYYYSGYGNYGYGEYPSASSGSGYTIDTTTTYNSVEGYKRASVLTSLGSINYFYGNDGSSGEAPDYIGSGRFAKQLQIGDTVGPLNYEYYIGQDYGPGEGELAFDPGADFNFQESSVYSDDGYVYGARSDSEWDTNPTGFIGLQFYIYGEEGGKGTTNYGYAEIQIGSVTVTGVGFETDPNTPIVIGSARQVPEPGSLALFALGATGLLALRRRRRSVTA